MVTYHPLHDGIESGRIGVGATIDGGLIGVAIADVGSNAGVGRLQSIVVGATFRGRGVAQGLVRALERRAREHASRIETMYRGDSASAPTVAHILAKAGWTTPGEPVWILDSSMRILEAPWMATRSAIGYEIFPWSELGEAQRCDLAAVAGASQHCPPELGPFPDEAIEPACSVGVRYGERVIGWMLTHRVDPESVRYSRLFVEPAHRQRFTGVALVVAALRRQHAAGIPKCLCAVASGNAPMMRIVRRRLAGYLDSRTELRYAYKDLA